MQHLTNITDTTQSTPPRAHSVSSPNKHIKITFSPSVLLYGTWVAKHCDVLMINKSFYSNIMDEFITE
jgi:hypothetical protein